MKVILRVMKGPTQTILSPYCDENALRVVKGPAHILLSPTYNESAFAGTEGTHTDHMLLEHERYEGLGLDALVTVCCWNTNVIMVWAWMLCDCMLLEHKRYYGLGMDAPVSVCAWNTNVIMVWAWMLR